MSFGNRGQVGERERCSWEGVLKANCEFDECYFNGTDDGMEGSLNGGGIKNDWRVGRQS
jgi:hypothetical protein